MNDFQFLLPDEETDYYDNYFTKTESLFSALRGRTLLLSPSDYQLAKKWYDQAIPLSCVLRGIRAAFFRKMEDDEGDGEIVSLNFCKWAVMKEWKEYKLVSVEPEQDHLVSPEKTGDETDAILESLLFDLHRCIFQLKEGGEEEFSLDLERIHAAVVKHREGWKTGMDLELLESNLVKVDLEMLDIAREKSPAFYKKAEQAVDRKMKKSGLTLTGDTLKKTREEAVKSKLRQSLKLPKITLYSYSF